MSKDNYSKEKKEFEKVIDDVFEKITYKVDKSHEGHDVSLAPEGNEIFDWITQVFAPRIERKERKKYLKLIENARAIFKGEDHIFVLKALEQQLKKI